MNKSNKGDMMKKINFTPLVYGVYFGVFFGMLFTLLYAPLIVSIIVGLAVSFFGAIITDKVFQSYIKSNNPFIAAKQFGKSLVLAFVPPNRLLLFTADKDLAKNKIRIKILKDGKTEIYDHFLNPNQEFMLEPRIEIKDKYSIYELLENPYIVWELDEPLKQVFKLDPFGVETVILVYPTEIITKEQLSMWNLQKTGEKTEVIHYEDRNGNIKEQKIVVPIYSPKPYAISSDNIKQLSASHRYSQISTILEQTRDILRHAENLAATGLRSGIAGIGNIFKKNPWLIIILVLLLGGVFLIFALSKFTNLFQAHTQQALTTILKNATHKFP